MFSLPHLSRQLRVAAVVLAGIAPTAGSDTLVAGFGFNKPPFVIGKEERGIEIDIVKEALAVHGHDVKAKFFPLDDLVVYFDREDLDAAFGIAHRPEVARPLFLSEEYMAFQNVAVSKKSSNIVLTALNDVVGHRVGAWMRARDNLGPDFASMAVAMGADYHEFADQRLQCEAFWRGRCEILLIDRFVFNWYRDLLAELAEIDTSEPVTMHEIFPEREPVYAVFRSEAKRDQFNLGIEVLKETGRIDVIWSRYMGPHTKTDSTP